MTPNLILSPFCISKIVTTEKSACLKIIVYIVLIGNPGGGAPQEKWSSQLVHILVWV